MTTPTKEFIDRKPIIRIEDRKPKGILPPVVFDEHGITGRIEHKPINQTTPPAILQIINGNITKDKTIFLGGKNLAILQGHKAVVYHQDGLAGTQEIHIIITGFGKEGAKRLVRELEEMKPEEINGA